MTTKSDPFEKAVGDSLRFTTSNLGGWQDRHRAAWFHPSHGGELRTVRMIEALNTYAREHECADGCQGAKLAEDGYAAPLWLDMWTATRKLLSMDTGRLDRGTLDSLLFNIGEAAGFTPEELER